MTEQKNTSALVELRDSLEMIGSMEANFHPLLLFVISPVFQSLKLFTILKSKSLGFSKIEIESLIKKGREIPIAKAKKM